MAAGKHSFTIEQGATTDFQIDWKDSSGNPVDLTQVATDPDGDTTPPNLIPKKKVQKITTDIFGKRKRQAKKDQTLQGSVNKI